MTSPNHPLFRTIGPCWSFENFPRLVDLPLRMPLHTDLLSLIPQPHFTIPQALNVFQPAVLPLSTPVVLCNPPFLTIHQCLPRTQSKLLISVTKPQSSPAYLSLPPPLYSSQTEVSQPRVSAQAVPSAWDAFKASLITWQASHLARKSGNVLSV